MTDTTDHLSRRRILAIGVATVPVALAGQVMTADAQTSGQPGALTVAPVSQSGLSPRLTMHAIDTYHGTPGAGVQCKLDIFDGAAYKNMKSFETAPNGRTAEPLLVNDEFKPGRYQLSLNFEEYFAKWGVKLPTPNFFGIVAVRFNIRDASQRYHLPILFSPWGYSYYRGS